MTFNELDEIMNLLNERKSIYPNICNVWLKYLEIKKEKLEKAILDTKNMIKIIDTIEADMSLETILFTIILTYNLTDI